MFWSSKLFLTVSTSVSLSLHRGFGSERGSEQAPDHRFDSGVCRQKRVEHLPDRDPPPLYAGYRRDQSKTGPQTRTESLFFPHIVIKHLFFCIQVIMIECADLKNVINYQEVEALKHTIKVQGGRDEQRAGEEGWSFRCTGQRKAVVVSAGFIHHQVEGS